MGGHDLSSTELNRRDFSCMCWCECIHMYSCPLETQCVSKRWILSASLTTFLSAKMLFHSPTDDRVSELQSVVNNALPITAFT